MMSLEVLGRFIRLDVLFMGTSHEYSYYFSYLFISEICSHFSCSYQLFCWNLQSRRFSSYSCYNRLS